jgi:hypothetical protein
MDLTEGFETSANINQTLGKHPKGLKPLKMDLTEGFETSANINQTLKPLKMDLTQGSETSANINQALGIPPKVDTVNTEHSENLKSRLKKFNGFGSVHIDNICFIQIQPMAVHYSCAADDGCT